jgi:hypothetical protein
VRCQRAPGEVGQCSSSRNFTPCGKLLDSLKYVLVDVQSGSHGLDHLASNIGCKTWQPAILRGLAFDRLAIAESNRVKSFLIQAPRRMPVTPAVRRPSSSRGTMAGIVSSHGDAPLPSLTLCERVLNGSVARKAHISRCLGFRIGADVDQ